MRLCVNNPYSISWHNFFHFICEYKCFLLVDLQSKRSTINYKLILSGKLSEGSMEHHVVTILKQRGMTLTQIGKKWGYSKASMSKALRVPHQAIETILARETGLSLDVLFPGRYVDGFPVYLTKERSSQTPHV